MIDPSCIGCHQIPLGSRRAVVPEFGNPSHHIQGSVTDADCQVCHDTSQHQGGTVRLLNVDTGAVMPYTGPTDLEPFCLACHDADGAAGSAPFSDTQMPPVMDQAAWNASTHGGSYTCADCHDNGHGSAKASLLGRTPPDGGPVDPNIEEERFCYTCHDGSVTAVNMQSVFNQASHHLVEQTGVNSYVECVNCHNPHLVNTANKITNPDDKTQLWAPGNETDFCLACHDGAPPAGVTFPASSPGTGFDKSAFVNSAHDSNLRNYGCRHCHDQHGSANIATLLENFVVTDYNNYATNDYALCWRCHLENVIMSKGTNTRFEDLHEKHVSGEQTPCIMCHDAHAPWDAGEAGLISFYAASNDTYDNYDFTFTNGSNLSSAFYISGDGGCYVDCHGTGHTPKTYKRNNSPVTYNCNACHPGGAPPPAALAVPAPLVIQLGVPVSAPVTPAPGTDPPPTPQPGFIVTATPAPHPTATPTP